MIAPLHATWPKVVHGLTSWNFSAVFLVDSNEQFLSDADADFRQFRSPESVTRLNSAWRKKRWANNEPPSRTYKGTLGGKAICFGACEDHQMAEDTSAFSSGKEMNGAMTYTFIRAIKENPNITYGGLLNYMHQSIVAANRGRCLPSLNLFNRKLEQDTVLSSSQDFDINQKLNL
nr:metacaspase-1 isoform X1 [Ipomoea trifida]